MTRFLTVKQVSKMTTLSISTIYRMIKKGTFPQGVMLSDGRRGWGLNEIEQWVTQKDLTKKCKESSKS